MSYDPIATGKIVSLCLNGKPADQLMFNLDGPVGDTHSGRTRILSGHDSDYIRTSLLKRGDKVFNWRSWTAISTEETQAVEKELGVDIPQGCLLENFTVSGIRDFSQLPPTSRLVFPAHDDYQAVLAIWEENGPCKTVGTRLAEHHNNFNLMSKFVSAAKGNRGVMGMVLSSGYVQLGDTVLVYLPV